MNTWIGTCGFSAPDWRGPVYPERLARERWLTYYEQELGFNALEINYTYYQMPSVRTLEALLRKTSEAFRFTIKTHRRMTHDVLGRDGGLHDDPAAFAEFREGLRPLVDAGRLGCVLAQFPMAFRKTPEHQAYVDTVAERLGGLELVAEFRHNSWMGEDTLAWLRQRDIGWCAVDEPGLPGLMPWVGEVTGASAYARFHGRNAAQWYAGTVEKRYDYLYSDAELGELAGRVEKLPEAKAKNLYTFFNNCHAGSAAKNALKFRDLLVARGLVAALPKTSLF